MTESAHPVTQAQLGIPLDQRAEEPPVVVVPQLDEAAAASARRTEANVDDMVHAAAEEGAVANFTTAALHGLALDTFGTITLSTESGDAIPRMGIVSTDLKWFRLTTPTSRLSKMMFGSPRQEAARKRNIDKRKQVRKEIVRNEATKYDTSKPQAKRVRWAPYRTSAKGKAGTQAPVVSLNLERMIARRTARAA